MQSMGEVPAEPGEGAPLALVVLGAPPPSPSLRHLPRLTAGEDLTERPVAT